MPESHYEAADRITENPGWAIVNALLAIADKMPDKMPLLPYGDRSLPATPSPVVTLEPGEVKHMVELLADADDHNEAAAFWIDPVDRSLKVRLGTGMWSPPMGKASS